MPAAHTTWYLVTGTGIQIVQQLYVLSIYKYQVSYVPVSTSILWVKTKMSRQQYHTVSFFCSIIFFPAHDLFFLWKTQQAWKVSGYSYVAFISGSPANDITMSYSNSIVEKKHNSRDIIQGQQESMSKNPIIACCVLKLAYLVSMSWRVFFPIFTYVLYFSIKTMYHVGVSLSSLFYR